MVEHYEQAVKQAASFRADASEAQMRGQSLRAEGFHQLAARYQGRAEVLLACDLENDGHDFGVALVDAVGAVEVAIREGLESELRIRHATFDLHNAAQLRRSRR